MTSEQSRQTSHQKDREVLFRCSSTRHISEDYHKRGFSISFVVEIMSSATIRIQESLQF